MIRTWDIKTGRQTGTMPLGPDFFYPTFALRPDGKEIAISLRVSIDFFDRTSDKPLRKILLPRARIATPLYYSPDGQFLASFDDTDKFMRVWDVQTCKQLAEVPAEPGFSRQGFGERAAAAFRFDSGLLATTHVDRVQLWDVKSWKQTASLPALAIELAFSPDGRTLACAGRKEVTVWELASGKLRARFPAQEEIYGLQGLRFSPDGRYLAWVAGSLIAEACDLQLGKKVASFRGHKDFVLGLTFSLDGKRLVTASSDCTLLVWDLAGVLPAPATPVALSDSAQSVTWADLSSPDAEKAYAAVRNLTTAPKETLAMIRAKLKPAGPIDLAPIQKMLADLNSPLFATRQRATKELQALGDRAEAPIRDYLSGERTEEARRRAEQVLGVVTGAVSDPERLRQVRAVEVLERIGDDLARTELARLASGAADAGLTRDAAIAIRRLNAKK